MSGQFESFISQKLWVASQARRYFRNIKRRRSCSRDTSLQARQSFARYLHGQSHSSAPSKLQILAIILAVFICLLSFTMSGSLAVPDTSYEMCVVGSMYGSDSFSITSQYWASEGQLVTGYLNKSSSSRQFDSMRFHPVHSNSSQCSFEHALLSIANDTFSRHFCKFIFFHDQNSVFWTDAGISLSSNISTEINAVLRHIRPSFITFAEVNGIAAGQTSHNADPDSLLSYVPSIMSQSVFEKFLSKVKVNASTGCMRSTYSERAYLRRSARSIKLNSVHFSLWPDKLSLTFCKRNLTNCLLQHETLSTLSRMNHGPSRTIYSDKVPPGNNFPRSSEMPTSFRPIQLFGRNSKRYLMYAQDRYSLLTENHRQHICLLVTMLTMSRPWQPLRQLRIMSQEVKRTSVSRNAEIEFRIVVDGHPRWTAKNRIAYVTKARKIEPRVEVFFRDRNRGLRTSWMTQWIPKRLESFNIVLEDDLDVSESMITSAINLIRMTYSKNKKMPNSILGISLFNEQVSDVHAYGNPFEKLLDMRGPTLRRIPCSWGGVFYAKVWLEFLDWYTENMSNDPLMPSAVSNRWSALGSWKKFAIRFMAEKDVFFLYPGFPRGTSLTVKLDMPGTNDAGMELDPNAGLQLLKEAPSFESLELAKNIQRVDHKMELPSETYSSFDGCEVIFDACTSTNVLEDLLHYYNAPFRKQIFVVSGLCQKSFEIQKIANLRLTFVYIKNVSGPYFSMRYSSFPEMKFDCVMLVYHPLDYNDITLRIKLWKVSFFDKYVGSLSNAFTLHYQHEKLVQVRRYSNASQTMPSALDENGSIFHRNYLRILNSDSLRPARNKAGHTRFCSSMLMSMIISNLTSPSHIIVDSGRAFRGSSTDDTSSSLECIRSLIEIFGSQTFRPVDFIFREQNHTSRYPVVSTIFGVQTVLFSRILPGRRILLPKRSLVVGEERVTTAEIPHQFKMG